jgi:glycosyltransferase involved in cell wall biosynthesis
MSRAPGSIALLIPAYQPRPVLADIARGVGTRDTDALFTSIVIVDDGSGPEYQDVFAAAARVERVEIVRRERNGGKGAALKAGMAHLLLSTRDFIGAVTADADGQHAAADIVNVANTFAARPDALVLGVRAFGANVPLRSRLGNLVTKRLVAVATGLRVADTQTGLRGWPRRLCERSVLVPANRFEFELITLLEAAATGVPIVEVGIETIYESGNPTSHFRPLGDSARIYGALARQVWHRLVNRA